jgi:hypothetical protein
MEFTAFMHNNHQRYGHHCPQGQSFVRTVHTYCTLPTQARDPFYRISIQYISLHEQGKAQDS